MVLCILQLLSRLRGEVRPLRDWPRGELRQQALLLRATLLLRLFYLDGGPDLLVDIEAVKVRSRIARTPTKKVNALRVRHEHVGVPR